MQDHKHNWRIIMITSSFYLIWDMATKFSKRTSCYLSTKCLSNFWSYFGCEELFKKHIRLGISSINSRSDMKWSQYEHKLDHELWDKCRVIINIKSWTFQWSFEAKRPRLPWTGYGATTEVECLLVSSALSLSACNLSTVHSFANKIFCIFLNCKKA